jgi:hypothetical protein
MNPAEQHNHKSRLDALAENYINVATAMDERAGQIEANVTRLVGAEHVARLQLATEQRFYVDTQDAKISRVVNAHVGRTFLARFRWLFLGR